MQLRPDGIARRIDLNLMTPAELAIRDAVLAVEAAGCHTLLTEAVLLLGQAQNKVADFVELPKDLNSHPIKVGDRVKCHNPGSWVDGQTMSVVRLHVHSSDGITGLLLQAKECQTIVEPGTVTVQFMEPCCDCGEDYPAAELMAGEVLCAACRAKPNRLDGKPTVRLP